MLARTNSGYKAIKQTLTNEQIIGDLELGLSRSSGITPYLIYVVFIATLGPLQFGYHLGELNAPEKVIICHGKTPSTTSAFLETSISVPQCISMTSAHWGLVQSIFTIGGCFGALFGGPLATKHGRLFSMRLIAVALSLGPLAEALATNITTLVSGRFISGISAGAATVVCPIYIAEISPIDKRGLFGSFTQVMINLGILISQALGYFLSRDSTWRLILAFAGFVAILMMIGLVAAPETPQWLAANYKTKLAHEVLQRLRGQNADITAEMQAWKTAAVTEQTQLLDLPRESLIEQQTITSMLDVVLIPKYRRAVIGVTSAMMAQQLCGINSAVMYSVAILSAILPSSAALITVMISGINVVVSVACAPLADKIGRKSCLLLSISGMGLNSVLLAIGLSQDIASLTVVGLVFFVCSFAVGLGPIPFILASELVGPEAVGAVSSWALAGNWASTFCVAQFFPILNDTLPRGQVYWIFASLALILGSFIAWWVPESKGKPSPDQVWGDDSVSFPEMDTGLL